MNRATQAIIAIIIVVAAAIGIGVALSHKNKTTPATPPPPPMSQKAMKMNNNPSPTTNSNQQATNKVNIANFAFSPADITVKKGSVVVWTNNDSTAHTVTSDSGSGPASETITPGNTYTFTFNTTGTFKYHCSLHPYMHGSVTVTE